MNIIFFLLLGLPVLPNDYKLQIEDEVIIYVSGSINFNYTETVSPQGTVFICSQEIVYTENIVKGVILETIFVKDLTIDSAQKVVQEAFNKYFKDVSVSLVVSQIEDVVYVSGAVAIPGAYAFYPGESAMYYIGRAGGLNERANTEKMYVIRGGKKIALNKAGEIDRHDTIVVEHIPLNVWSQYIGIASTMVGIIIAWVSLTR